MAEEEEELVSVVSVVARALIAIEIRFPRLLFLLDAGAEEKSAPPFPLSRRQTEKGEDDDDDDDNFTATREETEDVCIIITVIDVCSLCIFCATIFCLLFSVLSKTLLESTMEKKGITTRKLHKRGGALRARRFSGVIYLERAGA
jgi:hypothetical protein